MPVRIALLNLIQQIDQLLAQLSEEDYCRPIPEFDYHSLGQHFRHILEFFQCLQQGAAAGLVDYSARPRNALYESQPSLTRQAFEEVARSLVLLDPEHPIAVCADLGTEEQLCYGSTLGRELVYAFEHAIHHLAIVRIGLTCRFPHVYTEYTLGVAPATLKARQQAAKAL